MGEICSGSGKPGLNLAYATLHTVARSQTSRQVRSDQLDPRGSRMSFLEDKFGRSKLSLPTTS
jgi:hypothetical protein